MESPRTHVQSCSDTTQELSFSIRRILQDNNNEKSKVTELAQASERRVIQVEGNTNCRKRGMPHSEGVLLFPWQVVSKQANRRIGHPYQSRATPKRKKPRTTFSRSQISELEELFTEKKYLTSSERQRVANYLQLSDCQVKTWFQNRRTKWKRETDEEKEEQRHAISRAMMSFRKESVIPFQNCL